MTLQRLAPFRRLWRAQDTQPGQARRVLAEYGLGGAMEWAVPGGTINPDSGAATYPLESVWREVGAYTGRLTPGCMLEAHLMYCPAGLVQRPAGLNYESAGAWAEFRIGVTWTNGASSTGPHYWTASMEGSIYGTYGGLENNSFGADWNDLREKLVEAMRPPGSDEDNALAATYSEWSDVEITLEVRGGERIVHAVVYEEPDRHVHRHDNAGAVSVHGAPPVDIPIPISAREEARDTLAFENHRMGTRRTLQVAERQGERLGPHFMAWAHAEHDGTPSSARALDVAANTGFEDIFDSNFAGYDPQYPGWVIAGSTAQLHRLHGVRVRDRVAIVPVTVWVDAESTHGGGSGSTVRIQSGEYEWIDVLFGTTETRSTQKAYGYLQSQAHGDDATAVCVVQASVPSGVLAIYGVSVAFGHW